MGFGIRVRAGELKRRRAHVRRFPPVMSVKNLEAEQLLFNSHPHFAHHVAQLELYLQISPLIFLM
jgi:hypothetical protein